MAKYGGLENPCRVNPAKSLEPYRSATNLFGLKPTDIKRSFLQTIGYLGSFFVTNAI